MMAAPQQPTVSKRPNKPLVERKRRERINQSLDQMKEIVLQSLQKDSGEYTKMEKADILEMTVSFLRDFQRTQRAQQARATPPMHQSVTTNYRAGYSECLSEVSRYLQASNMTNTHTKVQLLNHLASNITTTNASRQMSPTPTVTPPTLHLACTPSPAALCSRTPSPASPGYPPVCSRTPSPATHVYAAPVWTGPTQAKLLNTSFDRVSPPAIDLSQTGAIIAQSYQQRSLAAKQPVRHQKIWRPF